MREYHGRRACQNHTRPAKGVASPCTTVPGTTTKPLYRPACENTSPDAKHVQGQPEEITPRLCVCFATAKPLPFGGKVGLDEQFSVRIGHLALWVMGENALALGADLGGADGMRDVGAKHVQLRAVSFPQQGADLLGVIGAAIHYRQQDAVDFELSTYQIAMNVLLAAPVDKAFCTSTPCLYLEKSMPRQIFCEK